MFENFIDRIVFANITVADGLELLLRVVLSCIFGFLIGLERTRRFKDAGVRTYTLVACASALLMIVSKYSAYDMLDSFGGIPDTGRIAAQVVSGISFLGAGVIFKHGASIKGLTTAAGIWVTSAIGLAVGAGMYLIGLFVTIIVMLLQFLMHKFSVGKDAVDTLEYTVTVKNAEEFLEYSNDIFDNNHDIVTYNSVIKNETLKTTTYNITVRSSRKNITDELIKCTSKTDNIISFISTNQNL